MRSAEISLLSSCSQKDANEAFYGQAIPAVDLLR